MIFRLAAQLRRSNSGSLAPSDLSCSLSLHRFCISQWPPHEVLIKLRFCVHISGRPERGQGCGYQSLETICGGFSNRSSSRAEASARFMRSSGLQLADDNVVNPVPIEVPGGNRVTGAVKSLGPVEFHVDGRWTQIGQRGESSDGGNRRYENAGQEAGVRKRKRMRILLTPAARQPTTTPAQHEVGDSAAATRCTTP